MNLILFAAGLAALIVGASLLVRGASRLALSLGISPLVVGLTVVALGTSSPEVAVSVGAALDGRTDLAVGNVVGSNIFNVLFILGVSALIAPLIVQVQLIRQEVPVMIGASVLLIALCGGGALTRLESGFLLALLAAYVTLLVVQSRRASAAEQAQITPDVVRRGDSATWDRHRGVQAMLVAAGLILLVLGSDWLVTAAVAFARALGVSDTVIGLTIVAAGTSLPEVAASVTAALKGERDIAVGNVVGSNTFNILGCLGLAGLVAPGGLPVAAAILNFDLWVMLAVALACLPVFFTGREIARWEGALLLGYYVAYTAYVVLAAQQHDALPLFSQALLWFAVPLTLLGIGVSLHSSRRASSGSQDRMR
ncbi:MAG: calcium/sodium antiporter [Steroidobacteraceae bacterium]|nr:calcium/sodium antiporter [Steroidobacteraceae bacterium]